MRREMSRYLLQKHRQEDLLPLTEERVYFISFEVVPSQIQNFSKRKSLVHFWAQIRWRDDTWISGPSSGREWRRARPMFFDMIEACLVKEHVFRMTQAMCLLSRKITEEEHGAAIIIHNLQRQCKLRLGSVLPRCFSLGLWQVWRS